MIAFFSGDGVEASGTVEQIEYPPVRWFGDFITLILVTISTCSMCSLKPF